MPSFFDGHLHLDKTLIGLPPEFVDELARIEPSGSIEQAVQQRIEREILARPAADAALSVEARARNMLAECARLGTLHLRTHVDVDSNVGLGNLQAVQRAVRAFQGIVDCQLVAFPQSGVFNQRPGAVGVDRLLREAVAAGADCIGGLDPRVIDDSPERQLDLVFQLAKLAPKGVDIHLHERGDPGGRSIREIAERCTKDPGLRHKVVISHAYCLGEDGGLAPEERLELFALLANSGIAIMSTGTLGLSTILGLRAAGVRVLSGNDNVYDVWCGSSVRRPDMLRRCAVLARQSKVGPDLAQELLQIVTSATAKATNLGGEEATGEIQVGKEANLLILEGFSTLEDALAGSVPLRDEAPPAPRVVVRNGRVLRFAKAGSSL